MKHNRVNLKEQDFRITIDYNLIKNKNELENHIPSFEAADEQIKTNFMEWLNNCEDSTEFLHINYNDNGQVLNHEGIDKLDDKAYRKHIFKGNFINNEYTKKGIASITHYLVNGHNGYWIYNPDKEHFNANIYLPAIILNSSDNENLKDE